MKEKSGRGSHWKGGFRWGGKENLLIVTECEIGKYFGDHLAKIMVKKNEKKS